jgi:hypothetical protein
MKYKQLKEYLDTLTEEQLNHKISASRLAEKVTNPVSGITPRRFDQAVLRREAEKILAIPKNGRCVIIVDQDVEPFVNAEIIDIRADKPETMSGEPIVCAIYAVDQDDAGLPFIHWLIERRIRFIPIWVGEPAQYIHKNSVARQVIEQEFQFQVGAGFNKFDFGYGDMENICQAIQATRHLDGAYVEVGCAHGSSGGVALRYMSEKGVNRPCYFFDVFDGFVYDAAKASTDTVWVNSHETDGIDAVAARLKRFEQPLLGRVVKVQKNNIVTDELPSEIDKIVVANLDVDQLEAIYGGLSKLAVRMVVGGILIVEDPGHTPLLIGSCAALDLFLQTEIGSKFTPIYMRSGQYFLVRTQK